MLSPMVVGIGKHAMANLDAFSSVNEFLAARNEFGNPLFREGGFMMAAINGVLVAKGEYLFGIRQPFFNTE